MRDTAQEDFEDKPWLPKGESSITSIDLNKVRDNAALHPSIRSFALHLTKHNYCNTGAFLSTLNFNDMLYYDQLYKILEDSSAKEEAKQSSLYALILLVSLLKLGEGSTELEKDMSEVNGSIKKLKLLFQIEAVSRRSHLWINYAVPSLSTDHCSDWIISGGRTIKQWDDLINPNML
jgi:hypothetical protein